ncbi:MAG: DUF4136 domain-containing protein [Pseudomonadota bacterium]
MQLSQFARAVILGIAALGLSTAASPPASADFYVIADGGPESGALTALVSARLQARGYRLAGAPEEADMLVRVRYHLDTGRTYRGIGDNPKRSKYNPEEFTSSGPSRFALTPVGAEKTDFGWAGPHRNMAYNAQVEIRIVRRADNVRLFIGRASKHGAGNPSAAVPTLVEQSLTQFPAAR